MMDKCSADYYYSALDKRTYIIVEDESLDCVFITPTQALQLLKWLQEHQRHIEELQQQEESQ